ncbi:hypothetical protein IHE45_17G078600 [Dioscorea alata]|uniref:Uncharacterized protein n=1 Tax=Dioscorea alata TaxID=55571 RepID=A0ACB7UDD9_DIOAL|nr:hypothetical protein IHE45_17G078600 [Dioscorea alata]
MVPNIELLLLTLIYSSMISCILLITISLSFLFFFFSSSILLLTLFFFDLYYLAHLVTWLITACKADLHLALVLFLCHTVRFSIRAHTVFKPWFKRALLRFKASFAHRSLHHL